MYRYFVEKKEDGYQYTIVDPLFRTVEVVGGFHNKKFCEKEAEYFCKKYEEENEKHEDR